MGTTIEGLGYSSWFVLAEVGDPQGLELWA